MVENMIIKEAKFIKSSATLSECPEKKLPEYVFLGRSNVGKSSLINMLVNQNKLSKISSKPGKTQLINHFKIDNNLYFVDLPGYGWAKTSKSNRDKWDKMTKNFLINSDKISLIFIFKSLWLAPASIFFSVFILIIEVLVVAIQAYIFTLLTALYIGSAMEEHEH